MSPSTGDMDYMDYMSSMGPMGRGTYWIGARDVKEEGRWLWLDQTQEVKF